MGYVLDESDTDEAVLKKVSGVKSLGGRFQVLLRVSEEGFRCY